mmetsp:Transcript_126502/g.369625  ORF Transcript_126502/g.369625 Transcript_126502/m.369625 type:complete len:321 (-) Transcript_126502:183-1145(-)
MPPHNPAAAFQLGPCCREVQGARARHFGHHRRDRRGALHRSPHRQHPRLAEHLRHLRSHRLLVVRRVGPCGRGRPGGGRGVRALRLRAELGHGRGADAELEQRALAAAARQQRLPGRHGLRHGAQHRPAADPVVAADVLRPVLRPGREPGLHAGRAALDRLLRRGQCGRLGRRRAHRTRRGAARRAPRLPARRLPGPRCLPPAPGQRPQQRAGGAAALHRGPGPQCPELRGLQRRAAGHGAPDCLGGIRPAERCGMPGGQLGSLAHGRGPGGRPRGARRFCASLPRSRRCLRCGRGRLRLELPGRARVRLRQPFARTSTP